MARLTVRNVDPAIAAALKARAERSGRSAEAEHRRVDPAGPRDTEEVTARLRAQRKLPPESPDTTELRSRGSRPERVSG